MEATAPRILPLSPRVVCLNYLGASFDVFLTALWNRERGEMCTRLRTVGFPDKFLFL